MLLKMNQRQCGHCVSMGVTTSARGEAAPERKKGGDNVSWFDANLIGQKIKENLHDRFDWYKQKVKI
jgi:hypothetical protein